MWRPRVLLVALCGLFAACSTGRGVRPLGAGRASVGLSLGGPVVHNLGLPAPLPLAAATLRLGATDRTDVDAAVHLPISRVAGMDVGASHLVAQQRGAAPAVMLGAHVTGLWATAATRPGRRHPGRAHRALASATARASWQVCTGHIAFVGLDVLTQPARPRWTPSASVGWFGRLGPRWSAQAQLSWVAFTRNSQDLVVHYADIAGRGSIALQFGFAYAWELPGHRRDGSLFARRRLP